MMKLENWLAFAGGMIVGGTMLMMLAPKSRKEVCNNIKRKMEDAKECMDEAMKSCHIHSCECVGEAPSKNGTATVEE